MKKARKAAKQHSRGEAAPQRVAVQVEGARRRGIRPGEWTQVDSDAARPFRIWDEKARHNLRWRCYMDPNRAQLGALYQIRWANVGETYTVYDARTQQFICSYTRRVNTIFFQEA